MTREDTVTDDIRIHVTAPDTTPGPWCGADDDPLTVISWPEAVNPYAAGYFTCADCHTLAAGYGAGTASAPQEPDADPDLPDPDATGLLQIAPSKTIFGWDASHYDWQRGPVDLAAAERDGINFFTHKACEGARFYRDTRFKAYAAKAAKIDGLAGAYFVNHGGDQKVQVDWFIACLDADAPWWRERPFLIQLDAEKFGYMKRAPSVAECQRWCDYFVERTGGTHRPVVYAPRWLYGDSIATLDHPLWASDYGANPAKHYRSAYPGDASRRWRAYGHHTPVILQYGSRLTIGSQHTSDGNAYRGSLADLTALVSSRTAPTPHPTPTPAPHRPDWTKEIIMALPTLKHGAHGQPVRNLQALLGAHGHATKVDGDFGSDTEAKVRAFQKAQKLSADGVVGRLTWTELIEG